MITRKVRPGEEVISGISENGYQEMRWRSTYEQKLNIHWGITPPTAPCVQQVSIIATTTPTSWLATQSLQNKNWTSRYLPALSAEMTPKIRHLFPQITEYSQFV